MRKKCSEVLRKVFHDSVIKTRHEKKLTQAQAAEKLAMDIRSYAEIERGKSCCSGVTLALYLAYNPEKRDEFFSSFNSEFEKALEE